MPKKQLETLTEPMYYTLIALLQARCGMEITVVCSEADQGKSTPSTGNPVYHAVESLKMKI